MPFRRVVFWAHLVCGLAAGFVILVMSVTGILLTYQKQMTEWSDREFWVVPAVEGQRAALSEVVRSAQRWDPEAEVSAVTVYQDPMAPVAVSVAGGRTVYVDPSTAEVRGENTTAVRNVFRAVVGVHRWFNVQGEGRAVARAVTGWSNLLFLFLVLSGLYLWVPRRWTRQHFRPILSLNLKARGRARDFNWHHVFGFWASIPLALVVASATVISFPWASDLAYRVAGDTPPVRTARSVPTPPPPVAVRPALPPLPVAASAAFLGSIPEPGPGGANERAGGIIDEPAIGDRAVPFDLERLDGLLAPATAVIDDWRTVMVRVPSEAGSTVEVRVQKGWGGEPQNRHTLSFDAATGERVASESFADQSRGRRFRTFLRFAHTGEYFGSLGQTIAGLASLAGVFLVWSGFALAWRRLMAPLVKKVRGAAV